MVLRLRRMHICMPSDPISESIINTVVYSYSSGQYSGETLSVSTTAKCLPTSGENNAAEEILFERLDEVHRRADLSCPFDLVPNEILSLILEHGYLDSRTTPPNSAFRAVAANISRRFRAMTLSTPSLWSVIHLTPTNIFDEVDVLPISIARSMTYPLDIHLTCFWGPDLTDQIMEILGPQSIRWRQLSITIMGDYILKLLQYLPALHLNALSITYYSHDRHIALPPQVFANDLPTLAHLILRNVDLDTINFSLKGLQRLEIRGHGTWPSFAHLNKMIGHSSRLRYLILHIKPSVVLTQVCGSLPTLIRGRIHLPELSHMIVYTSEWLSEDVANLIQLFACPKLRALIVREGVTSLLQRSNTVMGYRTFCKRFGDLTMVDPSIGHWDAFDKDYPTSSADEGSTLQPTLWVKAANIYHACNSLAYSGASMIRTLVLSKIIFPSLAQLRDMFTGLKSLENLSILGLIPTETLSQLMTKDVSHLSEVDWKETPGAIHIPKLKTLTVVFNPSPPNDSSAGPFGDGLREFLLLFDLPVLTYLGMKHLTYTRWRSVVEVFCQAERRYPYLTSLKLDTMFDALPPDRCAVGFVNPAPAFPRLETLSLKAVSSNAFLSTLLGELDVGMGPQAVFPRLTSLAISDDPCTSKPLLHRVITARAAFSRPLKKLYLDTSFTKNADSLEWMKEQVEVVSIVETLPEAADWIP